MDTPLTLLETSVMYLKHHSECNKEANGINGDCQCGLLLHQERITAMLDSGGWLPIETAPKDGTEIIGYREDAGRFLIRWDCPANFCTDGEIAEMGEESADQYDWFCADFVVGFRLEGRETPTHWQPLPPLPKELK